MCGFFFGLLFAVIRLSTGNLKSPLRRIHRSCATAALSKGVPIEQVQKMLGHEEINTTLTYISITDSTVKNSHRKHMG